MLWVYPERIQLSNFFWVLPTLLLYPIIALMHKTGWSPATLRVYTISSFSHAAAVFHTLTGHTAEWVPTGELRKTSMTSKVTMIMIAWTATLDFLMIAGVVKFVTDGRPLISVAPVMFYAVMSTYIWVPIARLAWSERAVRRASAATGVQAAQAAVLEATNGAPA